MRVMEEQEMRHLGVILSPSPTGFDSGAATWGCAYRDDDDPQTTYLYYTGANDRPPTSGTRWAIGVAVSSNGHTFRKYTAGNPLIEGGNGEFNSQQSLTPAVVRLDKYYMFFSGKSANRFDYRQKIGVAFAEDPLGPWTVLGSIAQADQYWESWNIDLGPSVVKLNTREVLVYYSNAETYLKLLFGARHWIRTLGILKVKITASKAIEVSKYGGNPLKHLNGPRGSPHESLFCPGYVAWDTRHFLIPSLSTYSTGFPFRQNIGVLADTTPYFLQPQSCAVLINGPREKQSILPTSTSELAFDTPCPVIRGEDIYLYYSVMDRWERIWHTALSVIPKHELMRYALTRAPPIELEEDTDTEEAHGGR
jgi:hypothetical protein